MYTRTVELPDITAHIVTASNPELTYNTYYTAIEERIKADGYIPETSMKNLVTMIILAFDCDDNYGEYDEESGCGGYGESFTLEKCFEYVENSGGYSEFDYYC